MMKRLLFLAPLLLAGCVIYQRPTGWIPARVPLSPERLVELKRAAHAESTIRRELDFHGLERKLTADDLIALKNAGVSDGLLTAVAEAPVKTPEEAKAVYHSPPHGHHSCAYCSHIAVPFFFATALSLNYVYSWGCHR